MYAIVDIETTGSYAAANGIIEISVQVTDGRQVLESFETLINPCQVIPRYIQALTGITNEMVQDAPRFEAVAERLYTLLQGNVFVAHNVNFDHSFVKNHLEWYGYTLNVKKLCTVRLARQIIPGHPSYSLGNLCRSIGIEVSDRHRAGGDARATVELFHRMVAADKQEFIKASLLRNSKEQMLPPNVPKEHFTNLPNTPGVYYFHDQKGKVIYVGKAKDIRKRITQHFSTNSDSKQRQNFIQHTYAISFQATATELMAAILESTEIKRLWPQYNAAQKKPEELFGIFVYEDQNGYMRLAIEKKRKNNHPIYTFHYKVDGHGVLRKLMAEFELCPKLCFMQTDNDPCVGIAEGYCHSACTKKEPASEYNQRVLEAIASLTRRPSYVVLDQGLDDEEQSCIVVLQGNFFGMGYLPANFDDITEASIQEYIKPYKDNSTIRSLLHAHISKFPGQVRYL